MLTRRVLVVMAAGLFGCGGSGSDAVAPQTGTTASIAITPSAPVISVGAQLALQAQVHDADGRPMPGATVFWSSLDSGVVTVTSTGVVTGIAPGSTQVAASSAGESAVVPVKVVPVPVASVAIAPSAANVAVGGTVALTAVKYDATGHPLTGRQVVWASSAPQVAKVDTSGIVTGLTVGTAGITALSEGKSGTATVTVQSSPQLVPVANVQVSPATVTFHSNQVRTLTATVLDAKGKQLSGRTVTWASSDSTVVTVTATGALTATVSAASGGLFGITTISATCDGVSGTSTVTLIP